MERVRFVPNIPQQLTLKNAEGTLTPGRWGDQMVYALVDGRLLSVNTKVAANINLLEIRANEPFCICKRWSGRKGEGAYWDVWRTPAAERARAVEEMDSSETELESQLRASIERVRNSSILTVPTIGPAIASEAAPNPVAEEPGVSGTARSEHLSNRNTPEPGNRIDGDPSRIGFGTESVPVVQASWAQVLRSQTEALTDVYAASIQYASTRHGNAVKPEDVRALMTTAFINLAQRGRYKVA